MLGYDAAIPMDFDMSISQVASWLDTVPLDQLVLTSQADGEPVAKRRRCSKPTDSGQPRRPVSPPASKAAPRSSVSGLPLFSEDGVPVFPVGHATNLDNEQTPRAESTSGSSPIRDAHSLSSQSDAAYSHHGKQSRRSQSPAELFFPLYGHEGHRLVRDSLSSATNAPHALPPTLQTLIGDIKDVAGRHGIMPRRIKAALEQRLAAASSFDRVYEYMFFDDSREFESDEMWRDCASAEELVRRASRIADRANECSRMLSDESAWNNLVYSPILDMFVHDMRNAPGDDVLDFMPCTTTNINPLYHRFPHGASRVDYVLRLLPKRDQTIMTDAWHHTLLPDTAPCFNWTTDELLQQYPLAISIETKRYGGDMVKGEQQLGIWHAAQWEFLTSRAGAEAVEQLGFLPGIVVQGHIWSLVITTRRQATTTVLSSVELGNTSSVVGVFQVIAGLGRLRSWSLDVLWPWYKKYLPELSMSFSGD
ncbi:hypothetical protein AK830_g4252 [Neonectria ditissima]|uniref:PD-(D/E)XK nuclease-like domain-containing protein n=1 Tax=Neonectria ditissima TaxID=78410 RepID=A0A0P7BGD3_9HYPO|nr:hypothetical protein AK830_g4252 [Neonectria ditissima]